MRSFFLFLCLSFLGMSANTAFSIVDTHRNHDSASDDESISKNKKNTVKDFAYSIAKRAPILRAALQKDARGGLRVLSKDALMIFLMVQSHQIPCLKPCGLVGWARTWRLTWTAAGAMFLGHLGGHVIDNAFDHFIMKSELPDEEPASL